MNTARRVVATSLLAFISLLAGCSEPLPVSTSPSSVTNAGAATYFLSGTVTETIGGMTRPLANHSLTVFVLETDVLSGDGLPTSVRATTDAFGRYRARAPRGRAFVSVAGRQQPCVASVAIDTDASLDVQVFPRGGSVAMRAAPLPLITGFVFEQTSAGRRPVRGATARLDLAQDASIANIETDETGRFFFCSVNVEARVAVLADGYDATTRGEFFGSGGDGSFEFELTR